MIFERFHENRRCYSISVTFSVSQSVIQIHARAEWTSMRNGSARRFDMWKVCEIIVSHRTITTQFVHIFGLVAKQRKARANECDIDFFKNRLRDDRLSGLLTQRNENT